ncbi:MAG TPA: hypothetical protein VE046_02965 [Steroidobacteraceae bacterium]|nr:hypothetical protein [Steroidobacteraceae bacterium]
MKGLLGVAASAWLLIAPASFADAPQYQNFRVAIYVVVNSTRLMADPAERERQFERAMRQVKFDKVYLEVYRDHNFATDAEIDAVKQFFIDHGVTVSGGITLAKGGQGGQFGTFDYEKPEDRAECRQAVELAARHFDEVILDDFFFFTSKSDADIAAKGKRSWTQYRLDTMRGVSRELVLKPAKDVNPKVRMIIKYPNWYEHFQGLGYDLEQEAQLFDAIYTGTETRDPIITDQLLQQYESYLVYRYFSNIRPDGANLGGWVDTFSTRYVDRYAEQLWDTLFAKAPEITLFNWWPMQEARAASPGERAAWQGEPTSFRWDAMLKSYRSAGAGDPGPGWGRVAGYALEQIDPVIGKLGKPVGIAAYKPYHSTGEDFLHNYLGNIGLPIELTPIFPANADLVLLTESAKFDRDIVQKIKAQLAGGRNVVITSGLLRALEGKGIEDIVELEVTGRTAAIREFINGYGAGNGTSLNDAGRDAPAVLFPEIRFLTNDSWPIIRGVAGAKGFPILLMNRYSKGVFYVLAIPDNVADLYELPRGLTAQIKTYLQPTAPVRIDSEALVSLFVYDNGTFVLQSFLPHATTVKVSLAGAGSKLSNAMTGERITAVPAATPEPVEPGRRRRGNEEPPRTDFAVTLQPHSYLVLRFSGP